MRNDLSDIEDVPLVVETVLFGNDLNLELPFSSLSCIEVVHKVTGSIIRIDHQIMCLFC